MGWEEAMGARIRTRTQNRTPVVFPPSTTHFLVYTTENLPLGWWYWIRICVVVGGSRASSGVLL